MKLIKASSMGFCRGVKRALDKAEEAAFAASLRSIPVYVYGDIVHSDAVMEHLSSLGIIRIENAEEAEVPGIVIIRAHGIPDDEREAFLFRGFEITDATCPVVLSNQEKIRGTEGKAIIIGKKGHPEVLALSGARRDAVIISSADDLNLLSPGSYDAVLQTTFPEDRLSLILEEAGKQGIHINLLNGICQASVMRRRALCDIIPSSDAVAVIGSGNSSNTLELLAIARESGKPAFLISSPDTIPEELYSFAVVGITAGASAPDSLVDAVVRKLSESSHNVS